MENEKLAPDFQVCLSTGDEVDNKIFSFILI